jgi:hypothetical protein
VKPGFTAFGRCANINFVLFFPSKKASENKQKFSPQQLNFMRRCSTGKALQEKRRTLPLNIRNPYLCPPLKKSKT